MADRVRKKSLKSGLPPGTLAHVGEIKMEEVKISIIDYDEGEYRELQAKGVEECAPFGRYHEYRAETKDGRF